jgi:transposase-like protein
VVRQIRKLFKECSGDMTRANKIYTEQEKLDAVIMVTQSKEKGLPLRVYAERIGVPHATLHGWIARFKQTHSWITSKEESTPPDTTITRTVSSDSREVEPVEIDALPRARTFAGSAQEDSPPPSTFTPADFVQAFEARYDEFKKLLAAKDFTIRTLENQGRELRGQVRQMQYHLANYTGPSSNMGKSLGNGG